jgi:hypothetical protein
MFEPGSTFRCNLPPRHIWVINSKPSDHDGQFVFVNFTTLRDHCIDTTCILDGPDYPPFLTQATTVAYSRAWIGNLEALRQLLEADDFRAMPPIPAANSGKDPPGGPSFSATSARA